MPPPSADTSHTIVGISAQIFFSPFILFYHVFVAAWTYGNVLNTLGSNPKLCYFVTQVKKNLEKIHLASLTYPHYIFSALSYFLVPQDASSSSSIFPIPILESAIFPRSLGFFYWRVISGSQDLAADLLCNNHSGFCVEGWKSREGWKQGGQ